MGFRDTEAGGVKQRLPRPNLRASRRSAGELVNWCAMSIRSIRRSGSAARLVAVAALFAFAPRPWAGAASDPIGSTPLHADLHAGMAQDPPPTPRKAKSQDGASGDDEARWIAEEIRQDDRMLRRGEVRKALRSLQEILEGDPGNAEARLLLARALLDRAEYHAALTEAERALADSPASTPTAEVGLRRACARERAGILVLLGRAAAAVEVLEAPSVGLLPAADARDAWALATAHGEAGHRGRALEILELGASTPDEQPWDALLARGQCERRLSRIPEASRSFVAADEASMATEG
jgi:tetratricopeptide (TPR) repeat protein